MQSQQVAKMFAAREKAENDVANGPSAGDVLSALENRPIPAGVPLTTETVQRLSRFVGSPYVPQDAVKKELIDGEERITMVVSTLGLTHFRLAY